MEGHTSTSSTYFGDERTQGQSELSKALRGEEGTCSRAGLYLHPCHLATVSFYKIDKLPR